ncbi:MAG: hypothetical protein JNM93_03110 [Bacteriovoracaceae bacterium]|nr:hypothetical protein [Bacteriovoracaceae bacterium]
MTKLYLMIFILLFSCAKLTKKGNLVKVIKVEPRQDLVNTEMDHLFKQGCEYKGDLSAGVTPGSTSYLERLEINMKNKVARKGGNLVLTSYKTYGVPPRLKGKYFSCPENLLSRYSEIDI